MIQNKNQGNLSTSISSAQKNSQLFVAFTLQHPFGSVKQTMNGEDTEHTVAVFYQFQIRKNSPLWQRLGLDQFYFMRVTGTNACHHILGWKGKQAISSPPAHRPSRLVQTTAEQTPANPRHGGLEE